jgi:hypothetical protein
MCIIISAPISDTDGSRVFAKEESSILNSNFQSKRRLIVRKTLDSVGSYVVDRGYNETDRIIYVSERNADYSIIMWAKRITETYGTVSISMHDGFYTAIPEEYTVRENGTLLIKLIIRKKES